jgi:hypothetical protein
MIVGLWGCPISLAGTERECRRPAQRVREQSYIDRAQAVGEPVSFDPKCPCGRSATPLCVKRHGRLTKSVTSENRSTGSNVGCLLGFRQLDVRGPPICPDYPGALQPPGGSRSPASVMMVCGSANRASRGQLLLGNGSADARKSDVRDLARTRQQPGQTSTGSLTAMSYRPLAELRASTRRHEPGFEPEPTVVGGHAAKCRAGDQHGARAQVCRAEGRKRSRRSRADHENV